MADSSGTTTTADIPAGTDTIMVTITVTNVDEKPTSFTGATTIVRAEEATALLMSDGNPVTYTASDPEGGVVTLTLSGDDDDQFKLTGDTTVPRGLEFREKPDFENPGDMNGDNVYEVTVVASDGVNDAMRDVTVKVTNIEEDGEIEVMPAQPRVGLELTAELTDEDGVVSGPAWQWYVEDNAICANVQAAEWEEIKDATSATYTPESDDNDACLRVTADYVDGFYGTDDDTDDMMFDKTVAFVLPGKVQGASGNMVPRFEEGSRAMRYVPEDAKTTDMEMAEVGKPVVAKGRLYADIPAWRG